MKTVRDAIPASERLQADETIRMRVMGLLRARGADAVFTYLSFGSEVDTRSLIRALLSEGVAVSRQYCPNTNPLHEVPYISWTSLSNRSYS